VRKLAAYYRRSPDQLSEDEVRAYILNLSKRGATGASRRTITASGISLNRDWELFTILKAHSTVWIAIARRPR
jgi:hypothetical protein